MNNLDCMVHAHVEGISDDINSGSDSFYYYYNYAVGFVATIYTCFAKLASRSTVDSASMAIGGIGYMYWVYIAICALHTFIKFCCCCCKNKRLKAKKED